MQSTMQSRMQICLSGINENIAIKKKEEKKQSFLFYKLNLLWIPSPGGILK